MKHISSKTPSTSTTTTTPSAKRRTSWKSTCDPWLKSPSTMSTTTTTATSTTSANDETTTTTTSTTPPPHDFPATIQIKTKTKTKDGVVASSSSSRFRQSPSLLLGALIILTAHAHFFTTSVAASSSSSSPSSPSSPPPPPEVDVGDYDDEGGGGAVVADLYSLTVTDVRGRRVSLEKYRGKVTLVVNVASECGFTDSHYHEMVEIREIFKNYDFEVLAFPCNQFGEQEPAPSKMVERFVKSYYKAAFPIFHKIDVKGSNASPVFRFLVEESGEEPSWNFWKYLVDRQGHVIDNWGPKVRVFDLYNLIQRHLYGDKAPTSNEDTGIPPGKQEL